MPRPIVVSLTPEERKRLADLARAHDRDVHQEARSIVRAAVRATEPERPPAPQDGDRR